MRHKLRLILKFFKLIKRDLKEHRLPFYKILYIHSKGFLVIDYCIMGRKKALTEKYLTSFQYYKMHPINGKYSKWIDDKLTLKYILDGAGYKNYMPQYYAQIDMFGNLLPLMDLPSEYLCHIMGGGRRLIDIQAIIRLLRDKGELVFKLIAGSLGKGFYKLEYKNEKYYMNGSCMLETEFIDEISRLKGYLICEYLHPHSELAAFCPNTTNTIRYLIGKDKTGKRYFIKSFVRFGTVKSCFVENYNSGGVLCYIDENGNFNGGYMFDSKRLQNDRVMEHPDSHKKLFGCIPMWGDMEAIANDLLDYMPQMKYLGIDFVATDKGEVKILEINSLTSLDSLQIESSVLDQPSSEFFRQLL